MEDLPESPYNNPALQEASRGDRPLLNRLVARELASQMMSQDPDSIAAQEHFRTMDQEVKARQTELGILPDTSPGEPH